MEEWKQLVDYKNYEVSSFGQVRNKKTGRILKPCNNGGYLYVGLSLNGQTKSFSVHRLVASIYLDNLDNKPHVNHKDKNKCNNVLDNLEWMTTEEQMQHKSIGLVYKSNKNRQIYRLSKDDEILNFFNSIEDAGKWTFDNKLTTSIHNGRNAISNCVNGLSKTAYNFKWKFVDNSLENEEWREINLKNIFDKEIVSEKKYYVSNLGRFKNSYGTIMDNYKPNENGYVRVYVHQKTFGIHILVANTFLENPENKKTVNHIDGNKSNNKVENLEFATNKETCYGFRK